MADYNRIVTAGPLVEDTGTGRVRTIPGLGTQVFYRLTDADAARLVRGVELTAAALFAAGARRMLLPFDGAPEVRSPGELRTLLARPVPKAAMQVYSIHLMGTARMSEDPRHGVTDSFGAVHGVGGLFVADASLFPGRSASTRWRRSSRWPCATRGGCSNGGFERAAEGAADASSYRQTATGVPGT